MYCFSPLFKAQKRIDASLLPLVKFEKDFSATLGSTVGPRLFNAPCNCTRLARHVISQSLEEGQKVSLPLGL